MIGIVGPRDSIALAMEVASEVRLDGMVLSRAYDRVEQAPALARQLDAVCHVLLFTGRAPYTLARQAGGLRAVLDFVPHGGIDLYRALVMILRRTGGRVPTVSLDTIDRATVDETYRDLGIAPPEHLLSLEEEEGAPRIRDGDDILRFHESCYRRGDVELCMTCLGSVRNELQRRDVPVVRVEHTRAALRDALARAALADRLAQTEASQVAVAVIDVDDRGPDLAGETPSDARRRALRTRQQILTFAERLQGTLSDSADQLFIVHATRGAIEQELLRLWSDAKPIVVDGRLASIGFGLGATATSAEENARQALAVGRRSGEPHLVLPDGAVVRIQDGGVSPAFQLRETDAVALAHADDLGLGPLTVARLVTALRRLDPNAVTARDLARAYGVTPRSALRLLSALERAKAAARLGRQAAPHAGRPQTIYRLDLARLLPKQLAADA